MNADEIVAFFVDEVAPIYNSFQEKDKKIYYAILQSLPSSLLDEVVSRLSSDDRIPWDLKGFIRWMQKDHQQEVNRPNEPIATLLRWYQDKKSKKVSYAYRNLVKRFEAQSFTDQKRILRAFLAGSLSSSEWAAKWLRRNWIPGFEEDIKAAWKAYRGPLMALTVISVMPVAFVMEEQDALVEATYRPDAYALLCGRLGRTPGFTIDFGRLSILDWFYIVGKLRMTEKIPEMEDKVDQYFRNPNAVDNVGDKDSGITRIIWAMKRVRYTEGLVRLARIEQGVKLMIQILPSEKGGIC